MADITAAATSAAQVISDQAAASVALNAASTQADIDTMQSRAEAGAANAIGSALDSAVQNMR